MSKQRKVSDIRRYYVDDTHVDLDAHTDASYDLLEAAYHQALKDRAAALEKEGLPPAQAVEAATNATVTSLHALYVNKAYPRRPRSMRR